VLTLLIQIVFSYLLSQIIFNLFSYMYNIKFLIYILNFFINKKYIKKVYIYKFFIKKNYLTRERRSRAI